MPHNKDFSNVLNFTNYMAKVYDFIVKNHNSPLKILDIPAGNGQLSGRLKQLGHEVVSADINNFCTNYVYQDMEKKLNFEDGVFDLIICLEGIEHIINKWQLVSEFRRVLNKKGTIIVSLPNIQSYYSRLAFLFTGEFFLYDIDNARHPKGAIVDRGHINRLSFYEMVYLFEEYDMILKNILGDKFKKKILFPCYIILSTFTDIYFWLTRKKKRHPCHRYVKLPCLKYSRSLIMVFEK